MTGVDELRLAALRSAGRPALLVVDVQRDFADPAVIGAWGIGADALDAVAAAVARCAETVEEARRLGIPVYWIGLGTPPDPRWRASAWLRSGDQDAPIGDDEPCVVGTPGAEWFGLEPAAGEERVEKTRYSGFLGTDLEGRLRAAGIDWVAVAGLTTECCVQATAVDAFQLGWPVVVLGDATAAYDRRLHEGAIASLALNAAEVRESAEVVALWSAAVPA